MKSSNLSTSMTPRERDQSRSPAPRSTADEINVVNIVIAKNFNLVDDEIQLQALQVGFSIPTMERRSQWSQLMRTRRVATEPGILNAPAKFLFLPLGVRETDQLDPPLNSHLVGAPLYLAFLVSAVLT
jgi:hypothetical protein